MVTGIHDLTMLYLKNQDISQLSPSQLFEKYRETYNEIEKAAKEEDSKLNSWF